MRDEFGETVGCKSLSHRNRSWSDIKEICYTRLLTIKQDMPDLEKLFDTYGPQLRHAANTRFYSPISTREPFATCPFLPQHFDILLELLRGSRRVAAASGSVLPSIIRDVCDQRFSVGPATAGRSAVGTLATTAIFTTRSDATFKSLSHVIEA